VQTIIDLYRGGMIVKDVATEFGISLSSVRRLLHKHGARLSDSQGAADR
jgi:transposase